MSILTKSPAWHALQAHQQVMSKSCLSELFSQDNRRFDRYSLSFNDIFLDFSKQKINDETINLLLKLAHQQDLILWNNRLFQGEKINDTEHRAALHIALRSDNSIIIDGIDVTREVKNVLRQMEKFTTGVRNGNLRGYSGKRFTDIVNIGIGGSDLGPLMVTEALKPYNNSHLSTHFVSNIDGTHLAKTLKKLNPETTLFIISSKTFKSQETMANATSAREWFVNYCGNNDDTINHFIAVSANVEEVQKFGIPAKNLFLFWDWVGGRFSLWSAIGLPIALSIGMDNFNLLLTGAKEMDQHFSTTPLAQNLPVILGLLSIWQINFLGATTHAIFPYDQSMCYFPSYLQQLEMESNGKCVTRDGETIDYSTSPVIWGGPGSNGQHAFYQLLHQGTQTMSVDFLAPCKSHYPIGSHHRLLLANFFAQTEAMMLGQHQVIQKNKLDSLETEEIEQSALPPYKNIPGNQATTSIIFKKLDPKTLGALIALYEHKVFVQSVIWNINPFDQWGVERGKQLAERIAYELKNDAPVTSHDSSTNGLINYFKANQ